MLSELKLMQTVSGFGYITIIAETEIDIIMQIVPYTLPEVSIQQIVP